VTYQVPVIPRPPLRTPIVDPVFGCTITRWTDPSMAPTHSLRHEYSRLVAFNADNTKAIVAAMDGGGYYVLELATGRLLGFPRGSLDPSATWHRTDPDRLIYYAGNEIRVFQVSTGQASALMKFPQYEYITTREEGAFSDDWRYAAFLGYKPGANWAVADFVAADLQANTIVGLLPDQTTLPDMLGVSPSGQYVVGTFADYAKAYDINLNFLRNLHPNQTHEDFAYDHNGDEVLVYYAWSSAQAADFGDKSMVGMVRLRDGQKTGLIDTHWMWGGHVSGIASRSHPGWILVEDYRIVGDLQASPFQRELFWLNTGTKEVRRLAHHHSDLAMDASGMKDYFAEPHAVPSWDGTMVAFASVWGTPWQQYDLYSVTGDWWGTGIPLPSTPPPAPDTTPPSVPSSLTATAVSFSEIDLAWTPSTDNVGVAGYRIYRNGQLVATGVTATSYADTNLAASTTYSYTVAAYDVAGNVSGTSTAVTGTTPAPPDTTPPSTPAGLTGTAVSPSQINLTWSPSTDNVGVAGYRVYRNGVPRPTTVTAPAYSDTNLSAATSYTYTVEAYDAAGNVSARSSSASATTPPSTPISTIGVVRDKSASGHSSWAKTCSSALTVGTGTNRALVVGVTYYNYDGTVAVNTVQYPGTTMTRVKSVTAGHVTVELWVGVNPASGTNTVAVTLPIATSVACGAASFAGVDQTTPLSNAVSGTGTGSTASMMVGSAVSDMTIGLFGCDSCNVFTFTNSKLWLDATLGWGTATAAAANGASTVAYTWTLYAAPWAAIGTNINAAR